jgi:ribosomal protein L37AE/L43A
MMTGLSMTTAEDRAREMIEIAMREQMTCAQCGSSTTVSVHGEGIWVECMSLSAKSGLRLAFSAGFHDRRRVELPEGALAAA